MLYRLIKKQQRESTPATENDATAGIASLILCATLILITTAASTSYQLDVMSFYMTVMGAMSLYFVASQSALDPQGVGSVPDRHGAAGNDDIYFETQHSALTDNKSANSSALVIGEHTPDRLTLEPSRITHRLCFGIGLIITVVLALFFLGGSAINQIWAIPAELKTALLLGAIVLLAVIINHLRQPMRRVVFDRNSGVFWIEHTLLFNFRVGVSAQMPLHQVVAVQRVVHPARLHIGNALGSTSQHGSTQELNVVFRNAERVNVVCHEDCHALRNDAAVLSNFLQVPVWVSKPATALTPN